jgi:hypothetical protein
MLGLTERAEKGEISEYETHLLQHAAMKPLLLGSSSSTCAFCSLKRSLALQKNTLQIARTSSKGLLCLFSAVTQRFLYWRNLAKKQIKN